MASNPMQKQARKYLIIGIVITVLITGTIIGFLIVKIKGLKEEIDERDAALQEVYVLTEDVTAGQILTENMFMKKSVHKNGIPANAVDYDKKEDNLSKMFNNYSLCDQNGEDIYVDEEDNLYMLDENNQKLVLQRDTEKEGEPYYYTGENGEKIYIELGNKTLVAKIAMKANTVLTGSLITRGDAIDSDDVRVQEYNMISLPVDLITGEYVDVRLMLPSGQDYIVVSKKSVTIPMVGTEYLADTIQMKLAEEEILTMGSAIVEAYKIVGSKLYVTKYSDAGIQTEASPTYVVNAEVANLIEKDPNIVSEAMEKLKERYIGNDGALTNLRNEYINKAVEENAEDAQDNVSSKMEESITSTLEARQEYLQGLEEQEQ